MNISGIHKTTLIDYPDEIATTLFTQGCNFRCPYCHNSELIKSPDNDSVFKAGDVINFLKQREDLIDGVVITGGEPLIQNDIVTFLERIKEQVDLKVKIDTNGSRPERLRRIIQRELVDFIAMDVKMPLEKYQIMLSDGEISTTANRIKHSVDTIKESDIDYEFRTTVVPTFHTKYDIKLITKNLINEAKKYVLQNYQASDKVLNKEKMPARTFPPQKLQEFKGIAEKYINKVIIRN